MIEQERRFEMSYFIIGALVGGFCGVVVMCFAVTGKYADREMENLKRKEENMSDPEGQVEE